MSFEKSLLDTMITKHYKHLVSTANLIVRSNRKEKNEHYDLVAETVEWMYQKQREGKEYIKAVLESDEDFIKLFSKVMKRQKQWHGGAHVRSQSFGKDFVVIDYDFDAQDPGNLLDIELQAENTNEATKDYIKDLVCENISLTRAFDYLKIMSVRQNLALPDRVLFDDAFVRGKSGRQIARETSERVGFNINHKRICDLVNDLRDTIKTKIK